MHLRNICSQILIKQMCELSPTLLARANSVQIWCSKFTMHLLSLQTWVNPFFRPVHSLIKSRFFSLTTTLLTVLTFLHFKISRILASGPKPCRGQNPAGVIRKLNKCTLRKKYNFSDVLSQEVLGAGKA